jgi:hypothetical protein
MVTCLSTTSTYSSLSTSCLDTHSRIQKASKKRVTVNDIVKNVQAAGAGEVTSVSGVELDLEGFTDIRFGHDRRLEEVARMLCSSKIPTIKMIERPDAT